MYNSEIVYIDSSTSENMLGKDLTAEPKLYISISFVGNLQRVK
jgi:hypothetical protein